MQDTVVLVSNLSRSFGRKTALDGVSFRATAGQIHGLVGANGAGKTTLLKHLLGLLRTATGSVRVFGLDPVRDPVGYWVASAICPKNASCQSGCASTS